jgi:hypothetical protein
MGSLRLQDGETDVCGPLEEYPEIETVRIERSAVVPGEEGCGCNLSFVEAGSSMMMARVFEPESSTDMVLLLELGEPANTGSVACGQG